jgi:hypothetical protein
VSHQRHATTRIPEAARGRFANRNYRASYRTTPQRTAPHHNVPQRTTTYHNVPQRTTTYHNVPQRTTTYHNVPQQRTTTFLIYGFPGVVKIYPRHNGHTQCSLSLRHPGTGGSATSSSHRGSKRSTVYIESVICSVCKIECRKTYFRVKIVFA